MFKGISRQIERCLKGDLRVFQEDSMGTSKKFKGCFKKVSKVF